MKLRLPRFTLRVLLLLIAGVAIVIGWHARRLHLRRDAIAQIRAKGGHVFFEHSNPFGPGKAPGPAWLRWLIGDDAFAVVDAVQFADKAFTDDDVHLLTVLGRIREVDLTQSYVSDAALQHLASIPDLVIVHLHNRRLTDEASQYLATCKSLQFLSVRNDTPEEIIAELYDALPSLKYVKRVPKEDETVIDPFE